MIHKYQSPSGSHTFTCINQIYATHSQKKNNAKHNLDLHPNKKLHMISTFLPNLLHQLISILFVGDASSTFFWATPADGTEPHTPILPSNLLYFANMGYLALCIA